MEILKIGYYCKYKDPKDGTVRVGLVINFDDNMVIVWKDTHPYPINRHQVTKGINDKTLHT
jgi:hypothetical protein